MIINAVSTSDIIFPIVAFLYVVFPFLLGIYYDSKNESLTNIHNQGEQPRNNDKADTESKITTPEPFIDSVYSHKGGAGIILQNTIKDKAGNKDGWKCYEGYVEYKVYFRPETRKTSHNNIEHDASSEKEKGD